MLVKIISYIAGAVILSTFAVLFWLCWKTPPPFSMDKSDWVCAAFTAAFIWLLGIAVYYKNKEGDM